MTQLTAIFPPDAIHSPVHCGQIMLTDNPQKMRLFHLPTLLRDTVVHHIYSRGHNKEKWWSFNLEITELFVLTILLVLSYMWCEIQTNNSSTYCSLLISTYPKIKTRYEAPTQVISEPVLLL